MSRQHRIQSGFFPYEWLPWEDCVEPCGAYRNSEHRDAPPAEAKECGFVFKDGTICTDKPEPHHHYDPPAEAKHECDVTCDFHDHKVAPSAGAEKPLMVDHWWSVKRWTLHRPIVPEKHVMRETLPGLLAWVQCRGACTEKGPLPFEHVEVVPAAALDYWRKRAVAAETIWDGQDQHRVELQQKLDAANALTRQAQEEATRLYGQWETAVAERAAALRRVSELERAFEDTKKLHDVFGCTIKEDQIADLQKSVKLKDIAIGEWRKEVARLQKRLGEAVALLREIVETNGGYSRATAFLARERQAQGKEKP